MRQTRKLRLGGVKKLIQGNTASRQKGRIRTQGRLLLKLVPFSLFQSASPERERSPQGAQGEHSTVPFASRPYGASSRRPWLNPNVKKKKNLLVLSLQLLVLAGTHGSC